MRITSSELTYEEHQKAIKEREIREHALKLIPDLISSFLYYDRKEDEDLSENDIKGVLDYKFANELSNEFRKELMKHIV